MANVILVVGEVADGALVPLTGEMLGAARRLAGSSGHSVARALAEYNSDAYLQAILKIAEQAAPAIILFGQTDLGRDLAPRLAFRLGTGVIMDTVELGMEGDRLLGTRPAYGGNARAVNVVRGNPQIATVRAQSQDAPPPH